MPHERKWFHDNQRKHFFLKEDDRITHCYRLGRFLSGDNDYNRWWKVPIPRRPRNKRKTLMEVPRECEIEYQLDSLEDAEFPPAAWLFKRGYNRHPRYNQWSELHVLNEKPESWDDYPVSADIDFETAPFRHEDFGVDPPERILCAKQHASKADTNEYTMWTEVLGQMKHLGYKSNCGCKRNAATAVMTRNYS